MPPGALDPAALRAIARHADAIATVRAFAERSDALRVVLLAEVHEQDDALRLRAGQERAHGGDRLGVAGGRPHPMIAATMA